MENRTQIADRLGVCHAAGRYSVGPEDQLTAGANGVLELGSRVIKLWFRLPLSHSYPFTDGWPEIGTLVDLARTPHFRRVFEMPFSTIVLSCDGIGVPDVWYEPLTAPMLQREADQLEELARYFAATYPHTVFVLQNWEGDWAVLPPTVPRSRDSIPTTRGLDGMAERFNARQAAVERGRGSSTNVLHAAEVCLVFGGTHPGTSVTESVLPQTALDLYSYSAWEATHPTGERFIEALSRIRDVTPASKIAGRDNVFVGEFGAQEVWLGQEKAAKITRDTIDDALAFGCPYVLYWQIFDNETMPPMDGVDYPGFWLLRPDGTHAVQWDVLHEALKRDT